VPLHPSTKHLSTLSTQPKPKSESEPSQVASFQVGQHARTASRIPPAKESPVQMDAKAYRKLTRGKLEPEGKIDLHGMKVDEAHAALNAFILRSHSKGRRLVLVITGKGQGSGPTGPIPYQRGILRRQVPDWLSQRPLAPLILQVSEANRRHGGEGALYVYLRRRR